MTAKAGNPETKRKINGKLTGKFAPFGQPVRGKKKKHENDRKRILGEERNEAVKKGEVREARRLSRMLAGRGMGARRHLSRILAKRQSLDESVKTLEQPIDKGGCHGLRIIFSDVVERMKERSDPTVVDQNAIQQGHRDWKCLQAAVWKLRHWRASVPWSIPAELLKVLVFPNGGAHTAQTRNWTQHET